MLTSSKESPTSLTGIHQDYMYMNGSVTFRYYFLAQTGEYMSFYSWRDGERKHIKRLPGPGRIFVYRCRCHPEMSPIIHGLYVQSWYEQYEYQSCKGNAEEDLLTHDEQQWQDDDDFNVEVTETVMSQWSSESRHLVREVHAPVMFTVTFSRVLQMMKIILHIMHWAVKIAVHCKNQWPQKLTLVLG